MTAKFAAASSQYLSAGAPVTTFPFTVGFWSSITPAAAQQYLFILSNTASDGDYFSVTVASTEVYRISAEQASGGVNNATCATVVPEDAWNFCVARFIDATNRRLAVLYSTGATEHVQGVASRAPTGINTTALGVFTRLSGNTLFFTGRIGEFWMTGTDIQPDGAQLQDSLLRQLAYGGPFSVPHIAKDIVQYRSFRTAVDSRGDNALDVYSGRFGRQTWTNNAGVEVGPHPPLPYWYSKPPGLNRDTRRKAWLENELLRGTDAVGTMRPPGRLIGGILTRPKLISGRLI